MRHRCAGGDRLAPARLVTGPERRALRAAWRAGPHRPSSVRVAQVRLDVEAATSRRVPRLEVEPDDGAGAGTGWRRAGVAARAAAHVGAVPDDWSSTMPEPVLPDPVLPLLELDDGEVVDELRRRARARVARRGRRGGGIGDQRTPGDEAGGQRADGQHVA